MCGINLWAWKDKSCELCQNLFDCNEDTARHGRSKDNINAGDLGFCNENLRRRGPDSYGNISSITYPGYHRMQCAASVLQMRADLQQQPLSFVPGWKKSKISINDSEEADNDGKECNRDEAYLCWNGEIYQQAPSSAFGQTEDKSCHLQEAYMYDVADTTLVADHLQAPIALNGDKINTDDKSCEPHREKLSSLDDEAQHHIANVMAQFYNAEFAFCIVTQDGVFYGRDTWGRRSLLRWECPKNCGSFQIVSVAETFAEKINTMTTSTSDSPIKTTTTSSLEWTEVPPGVVHCILFSEPTKNIPGLPYPEISIPKFRLPKDYIVPPIPRTIAGPQSPEETISERLWRVSLELESCLRKAVTIRLDQSSHRRSTGVLFSGGVDSAVLAALAADILASQYRAEKLVVLSESRASSFSASPSPPVPILYLYNVSFGPNPEKSADRQAALKSYQALRDKYELNSDQVRGDMYSDNNNESHCVDADDNGNIDDDCDIKIMFRDIVVGWEDICRTEPHIRTLISPKSTVMDVNIATALWFASRGAALGEQTSTNTDPNNTLIDSNRSPRVLLLGMGADELMGGYGRHRKAYERGGWQELQSELTMDQNRLWERNCGRDDRLCSDHGREARFPFLDAHVVRLLREIMANEDGLVCDFRLPPGVGDKRILRLVAQRLGLEHASGLVKRAIQFGSRISHLSDKKRFGSRRKAKGSTKI